MPEQFLQSKVKIGRTDLLGSIFKAHPAQTGQAIGLAVHAEPIQICIV
jgi:hypothetical protein